MRARRCRLNLVLVLAAVLSPVWAAQGGDSPRRQDGPPSADIGGLGQAVATQALAASSGGSEVTERMTLTGTVTHNRTENVLTGSNAINGGAFSGAAGVPMVIQNTGNSVLIQNATIINVQFRP